MKSELNCMCLFLLGEYACDEGEAETLHEALADAHSLACAEGDEVLRLDDGVVCRNEPLWHELLRLAPVHITLIQYVVVQKNHSASLHQITY